MTQRCKNYGRILWKTIYHNKLNSLEEMDMFLEMYNLPKLNREEIYNLNRLEYWSQTESAVLKNWIKSSANKSPRPNDTTDEIYQNINLYRSFWNFWKKSID